MKQKILDKLKSANCITSLQQLVANAFYQQNPDLYFLGLYLASVYSSGSLYAQVQEAILPSIDDLWGRDCVFDPEEIIYIQNEIRRGFLLSRTVPGIVVAEDNRIFFERAYKHLLIVKEELLRIGGISKAVDVDEALLSQLQQLVLAKQVTEEQSAALYGLLTNTISILYGGPGTGKTYTAGMFLKLYLSKVVREEREKIFIALSGPTGKATQNLKGSIERAFGSGFAEIENCVQAKTLHSLLGISSFGTAIQKEEFLPYQLIIIDEASMIDISMMSTLLSRIKKGTKVLLLGDPNQLPPIEPGAIFAEFIQQQVVSSFGLSTCLRAEMQELVDFSHVVLRGTIQDVGSLFLKNEGKAVVFHEIKESIEKDSFFVDRYTACYKECYQESAKESLFAMQSFRILTPMNEGPFGIHEINNLFQKKGLHSRFMPLIVTRNDYEYSLMNGQMGVVNKMEDTVYFFVEGKILQLPEILLPPADPAWCLSIHKSQGSEFDHVVLLLPPGCEHFGKKMLYTAITRAKKKIEIYSSIQTLQKILAEDRELACGLKNKYKK